MKSYGICLWQKALTLKAIRAIGRDGCYEDDKWKCVVGIDFIIFCECVRSYKLIPKLRLASGFTLTKVQETYILTRPSITQNESDNFSSGISAKLPKIATSNAIFSRTDDRIEILHDNLEDQAPMTYIKNVFILLAL